LTQKIQSGLDLSSSVETCLSDSCFYLHTLQLLVDLDHYSAAGSPTDLVAYQKVAEDREGKDLQTKVEA
jgi:hypothetical protein